LNLENLFLKEIICSSKKNIISESIKERKVGSDKLTDYCFSPFYEIITSSKKNIILRINKREKSRIG
jgi:hypothetical protein